MIRVIGNADRALSESVPAAPDEVRDYCVDLCHITDVHPSGGIRRVDRRGDAVVPVNSWDAEDLSYRVRDGVMIGPVVFPLRYTVRMRVPVAGAVTAETNPFPLVRLESVIAFEPLESGTRLKEHLRISAPRPLLSTVVSRTVAAHTHMLAGVRRHFEGH